MKHPVPTKVFYNSACPVCDAGITAQKAKMGDRDMEWIDIHANPDAVQEVGADLEAVRERLHVKGPDGGVAVGASALAALWEKTPSQRFLAKLVHLPVARSLAGCLYDLFARALYKWNRWRKHW